jgi:hypothetical protein
VDQAPPRLASTSSRLIGMAVSLVGEAQSVAHEMKCSNADFLEYCAARKEPPAQELDRLITLIIREQGRMIAKNRELLAALGAQARRL